MKKTSFLIMLLFFFVAAFISNPVFGLEVNVEEIRIKPVIFINYKGENKKQDSLKDMDRIGKVLSGDGKREKVSFFMKYSIIHVVSKEEPEKFSADIFSVDKDAKAGHIDMIRRIVASYLIERYSYSMRDAETISLFLSYYNAAHRGDTAYFSSKYKASVLRYINAQNAGISTKYWEWAGRTRMLIPLSERAERGALGSVPPDIISDKKITEEVRRDDKNLPKRKDMADLKERLIEKDKKETEKEKENISKEAKKIEEEKKPIEKKKEEISKKEQELNKEKEDIKTILEPEKRKEKEDEIKKKEEKIEAERDQTVKKEEELNKKEEEIKREQQKTAEKEKKIVERESRLQEEKKEIERDELKRDIAKEPDKAKRKLEEKERELDSREDKLRSADTDKSIYANKLYYLKIKEYLEGGHYNNEMFMIDAGTRKILFKSPVVNICGSRYDIFSDGIVVITHMGNHSGHRLALMDRDKLEAKLYGLENIFWRSFIEIRDGFIFAIINDKGKYYLGRFDGSLKLTARSKEEINEDTFVSFWENYIYINRLDKSIIVLNKEDLSLIDIVKP